MKVIHIYRLAAAILFVLFLTNLYLFFSYISETINTLHSPKYIKTHFLQVMEPYFYLGISLLLAIPMLIFTFLLTTKQKKADKLKELQEAERLQEEKQRLEEEERQQVEQRNYEKHRDNIFAGLERCETLTEYCDLLLSHLTAEFEGVQGMIFIRKPEEEEFKIISTYAFYSETEIQSFKVGEGISGQVAKNREALIIGNIPENYLTILSGLGKSLPSYLAIFPVVYGNTAVGIGEIATFKKFPLYSKQFFNEISMPIGIDITRFVGENYE